jgi:hypothetical protein
MYSEKLNISFPKTLYKYRYWENFEHKKMLTDNELFFTSPKKFNDPFDINIPFRFDKLSSEEFYNYLEKYFDNETDKILVNETDKIKIKEVISGTDLNKIEPFIHLLSEIQYNAVCDIFGIFSLASKRDNILMWSHYSNCHQGFCIGFDFSKLEGNIIAQQKRIGFKFSTVQMQYKENYPELILSNGNINLQNLLALLSIKSILWKYEEEFRIISTNKNDFSINVDSNIVSEIILGLRMPSNHKKEIINIASKKFPHAKIYQAKKSIDGFKLELELV